MFRLLLKPNTLEEKAFELSHSPFSIGRAEGNDVGHLDRSLSRQHARLELTEDGQIILVDLDSKNGTFINGERITRRALRPGGTFRCGDVLFSVQRHEVRAILMKDLETPPP